MLPYTAEVLFAFFAQYNRAVWPLPVVAPLLGLAVLAQALLPVAGGGRAGDLQRALPWLLLAAAWAWVGWGFFLERFAAFNFASPLYGGLFLLQGVLLLASGLRRSRARLRFSGDRRSWCGLLLAAVALAGLPLAGPLQGDGWAGAPLVGLMPGPTVLFTLGLLLLADGRPRLHLAVLPLLWIPIAAFEGWALGLPGDLAVAGLGLVAGAALLQRRLRHDRAAG